MHFFSCGLVPTDGGFLHSDNRNVPLEGVPMVTIMVNGVRHEVQAPGDTPLLYVLRNDLQLIGPQFGCGLAQCGACAVLVDGKEVRSCIASVSEVANQEITTLEGLSARWAKQKGLSAEDARRTLHPVQQAWIEEQTPQCGFCQNGMMIKATELLESNPNPTLAQIKEAFTTSGPSPNLCRCGTYVAIIDAVKHAAAIMAKGR
jgi:aerobic-type carbon monoxide dehydrogenase small subunit (CoxS/CutS family)